MEKGRNERRIVAEIFCEKGKFETQIDEKMRNGTSMLDGVVTGAGQAVGCFVIDVVSSCSSAS